MTRSTDLISTLRRLTDGLLWMSETDAPFEVVEWQRSPEFDLTQRSMTERQADAPIETVELDDFFAAATADQAWFGEEERTIAQRYRELVAVLKRSLHDLKVYRVGEVKIDVYIVGKTETGQTVGLKTHVVET